MGSEQLARWIAVNNVPGLGPRRLSGLYREAGTLDWLFTGEVERAARSMGVTPDYLAARLGKLDLPAAARELKRCRDSNIKVVTMACPDYPALLHTIPDPPPVLYCKGRLPQPSQILLAVVGSRKATAYGRRVTRDFVRTIAASGVGIVSGLALGIDAAAHAACLDVKGYTIAVLGNGLDISYPPANRNLYARVAELGCLISEFPLDTPPRAAHFPRRNRLISGLCRGILVAEAALRSGAMITVGYALEQGRDVFAVPGNITSSASAGCNRLIEQGARPALSAAEILAELGVDAPADTPAPAAPNPTQVAILKHLDQQGVTLDDLSFLTGLTCSTLLAGLVGLELQGLVQRLPGQKYARIDRTEV